MEKQRRRRWNLTTAYDAIGKPTFVTARRCHDSRFDGADTRCWDELCSVAFDRVTQDPRALLEGRDYVEAKLRDMVVRVSNKQVLFRRGAISDPLSTRFCDSDSGAGESLARAALGQDNGRDVVYLCSPFLGLPTHSAYFRSVQNVVLHEMVHVVEQLAYEPNDSVCDGGNCRGLRNANALANAGHALALRNPANYQLLSALASGGSVW